LRQHLLDRTDADPLAMVEHLVGLQTQEPLPPYLSLHGRLRDSTPALEVAGVAQHLDRAIDGDV
jgi:hypothetical protein